MRTWRHERCNPATWKVEEHSLIGSKILLQVEFQHVPKLFTMPLQLIVSIQTIFLFSLKVVICWTAPEKLEIFFFFWKKNHPLPLWCGIRRTSDQISCFTVFTTASWGCLVLCAYSFFFYLGKLHFILLLLKVGEEIEDWLQGYGVPWEKSSYIKALFRVNYSVFWKSYCRHPCCFYWSYRFSTGAFRVRLCFGDWHILFEFAKNSTG